MKYVPGIPPQDTEYLVEFLHRELLKLQDVIDQIHLRETLHVAPEKPQIGQIEYADGTDWDPASGEGLYEYKSTGWSKL